MRLAVRRFQQKHMIYEANYLRRKTVDALARPLIDNDYDGAGARAARARGVGGGDRRGRRRPTKAGSNLVDEYLKIALEQLQLDRRARRRWRSSSATPPPSSSGCARRSSCPRGPTTTPTTWTSRSSSIAATSGTTCRSTPSGHYKPQPRKKYPSLTLYTKASGKQIALARWRTTIGGWRAEQAGERLRVLPLQGVGRRPARDPQRRLGAGLDRARVDADPLADQGQDRQRNAGCGWSTTTSSARATCRPTASSPVTSSSPARTAGPTGTTACARTARPTTCRSTARTASRTAATGCRTTSRSACIRSSCGTAP